MKDCCKIPDNWKNDGTRKKSVTVYGDLIIIIQENYLTCEVCKTKLSMLVEKKIFSKCEPKILEERA